MMARHRSRRVLLSVGAALALYGMNPFAVIPLARGGPDAESPASVKDRPAPAGKAVQVIQVSADLLRDLDRLEKRDPSGDVYDLFSKPAAPQSVPPSKRTIRVKPALPEPSRPSDPDEAEAVVEDPVVSAPSAVQLPIAPVQAPVAAPFPPPPAPPQVVAAPPPLAPVQAPVAALPPPPPAPKPPAVPFAYMGRFEEKDRTVYFLVKGDRLYMVKAGDDIDEAYSFDGEVDHQLRFTYKPLRLAQTLTVGP